MTRNKNIGSWLRMIKTDIRRNSRNMFLRVKRKMKASKTNLQRSTSFHHLSQSQGTLRKYFQKLMKNRLLMASMKKSMIWFRKEKAAKRPIKLKSLRYKKVNQIWGQTQNRLIRISNRALSFHKEALKWNLYRKCLSHQKI